MYFTIRSLLIRLHLHISFSSKIGMRLFFLDFVHPAERLMIPHFQFTRGCTVAYFLPFKP